MELSMQSENASALLNRGKPTLINSSVKKEKALSDVKNTLHAIQARSLMKNSGFSQATPVKPTPSKCLTAQAAVVTNDEISNENEDHHDHDKCEFAEWDDLSELRISQATLEYFSRIGDLLKPRRATFRHKDTINIMPELEVSPQYACRDFVHHDQSDYFNDSFVLEAPIVPPL